MALILDGKLASDAIATNLTARVLQYTSVPTLAIIQVGDDARSAIYIRRKQAFATRIGAHVEHVVLPETSSTADLIEYVLKANASSAIHGIIVQMPVPANIDMDAVLATIEPSKDVDGLGPASAFALLASARPSNLSHRGFVPATARGIITLLEHYGIALEGANVVVLGRSAIAGLPAALAALGKDATVTLCHRKTPDLIERVRAADIVITAIGVPHAVTAEMASAKQVIVDVGITPKDGRVCGDVDFDTVSPIVRAISPVPGGVGPMTVASLFQNLCDAYDRKVTIEP